MNVKELDCDFYTFSGHKMYGPSGIGTARSLEGFVDNHQLPFRKTFKESNYWKLGHYCELGDGKFSLTAGFNSCNFFSDVYPNV